MAVIDKYSQQTTVPPMANTLNISLEAEQKSWLNTRKELGGYSSTSDVVRALIRTEQQREQAALLEQFKTMEHEGSNQPEPEADVLRLVKRVKKARRA
jgi:antitoxin ParD1/3/4